MVIKPGIQVKLVINATATDLDEGNVEFGEQRHANAEILRRLFFREAALDREGQAVMCFIRVHVSTLCILRNNLPLDFLAAISSRGGSIQIEKDRSARIGQP